MKINEYALFQFKITFDINRFIMTNPKQSCCHPYCTHNLEDTCLLSVYAGLSDPLSKKNRL